MQSQTCLFPTLCSSRQGSAQPQGPRSRGPLAQSSYLPRGPALLFSLLSLARSFPGFLVCHVFCPYLTTL